MSNTKFPPFFIGQRVVALKNSTCGYFKKGIEYTVKGVEKCKCGIWNITIGFISRTNKQLCAICKSTVAAHGEPAWHGAKHFAPVEENFQSISLKKVLETETPLIGVN